MRLVDIGSPRRGSPVSPRFPFSMRSGRPTSPTSPTGRSGPPRRSGPYWKSGSLHEGKVRGRKSQRETEGPVAQIGVRPFTRKKLQ